MITIFIEMNTTVNDNYFYRDELPRLQENLHVGAGAIPMYIFNECTIVPRCLGTLNGIFKNVMHLFAF